MSTMKYSRTVFYGPSTTGITYPSVGSVSAGESINILWQEGSYAYIEYNISGGQKKCGYVLYSDINVSTTPPYFTPSMGTRYVNTAGYTYTGPTDNGLYPNAGSVSLSEAVEYTGKKSSDNVFAFIEYNVTGGQKKRAWFRAMQLSTSPPSGGMSTYATFKVGNTIPSGLPYAGASVSQGWNDTGTNRKGHLGYDMIGFSAIKPIFNGTVAAIEWTNGPASGRAVCIQHNINGVTFYSTYCHLASITSGLSVGNSVTTNTQIGIMGASGGYSDGRAEDVHLHLCVYTGSAQTNPSGYCSDGHNLRFDQVSSYANPYYYGPNTSMFPRCGGVCFYDPYGVITSNAAVIALYP